MLHIFKSKYVHVCGIRDQICGLLNAEKGLCCYSVVNAYLETFTARDANVVKTTTDV